MHKRESGVNPERYRHCVWELYSETTGKPGRECSDERSQETCLCEESQARCTQADISASLPAARFFRGAVLLVGIVRAAVGHHGRFYISFRTIFEEAADCRPFQNSITGFKEVPGRRHLAEVFRRYDDFMGGKQTDDKGDRV